MTKTRTQPTAADVMRRDVLVLNAETSVEEAISTLEEAGYSGAPVVDASDRLVGVFSVTDVAKRRHVRDGAIESAPGNWDLADEDEEEDLILSRDDYSPAVNGGRTVGDWMHTGLISVPPEAGLKEVCWTMIDGDVHRVLVVEGHKLVGLITSLDVVRYVAER